MVHDREWKLYNGHYGRAFRFTRGDSWTKPPINILASNVQMTVAHQGVMQRILQLVLRNNVEDDEDIPTVTPTRLAVGRG